MREPLLRLMVAAGRFARAELALVGALMITAFGIFAFVDLTSDVLEGESRRFDRFVLDALRTAGDPGDPIGPQWVEIAVADLTALGGIAVLAAIVAIVSGFLLIQRRALAVMLLLTALLGGVAMSQVLKQIFGRERPPPNFQAADAVNASFPSGHAMLSAVVFLTLGAMVAKALPRKRQKIYVMTVAVLLTAIVGLSRAYLGVHWATDVLAGWSVGAAWAMACWAAAWGIERWYGRLGVSPSRPRPAPGAD